MPFESKQQAKALFAKSKDPKSKVSPKMVKEWAKKTKKKPGGFAGLPEKKGEKDKKDKKD